MARLSGPPDRSLEFEPVSYQYTEQELNEAYPGMPWEVTDANWVNVRITVDAAPWHWTATDPCYTTWSLPGLVSWFRALASGQEPEERTFTVLEPDIQFEALGYGEDLRLRVLFQLEFRPPGLPFASPKRSPAEADADDVVVEYRLTAAALLAFADALEAEAGYFPVRE